MNSWFSSSLNWCFSLASFAGPIHYWCFRYRRRIGNETNRNYFALSCGSLISSSAKISRYFVTIRMASSLVSPIMKISPIYWGLNFAADSGVVLPPKNSNSMWLRTRNMTLPLTINHDIESTMRVHSKYDINPPDSVMRKLALDSILHYNWLRVLPDILVMFPMVMVHLDVKVHTELWRYKYRWNKTLQSLESNNVKVGVPCAKIVLVTT